MNFPTTNKKLISVSLPARIYRLLSRSKTLQSITNFIIRRLIPAKRKIPEGIIILNQRDVAVSSAIAFGMFENTEIELFRKTLRPGMTVIDIGANIGLYTIIAARLVGPTGRIFAYEPEDENFEILKKNIAINNLSNVTPIKIALADMIGETQLYLDDNNKGHHSFAQNIQSKKIIRIQTDTLDNSLQSHKISKADIIKMDIEGAEGLALRGMEKTIAQNPKLIMFTEFYPEIINRVGGTPSSFITDLITAGFSLSSIDEDTHTLQTIDDIDAFIKEFSDENQFTNIYAKKVLK